MIKFLLQAVGIAVLWAFAVMVSILLAICILALFL